MDRSEKIYLIGRAAKGAPEALEFWLEAYAKIVKFQCRQARTPMDAELISTVRLAVWRAARKYEVSERTGWGNTWTSYLSRAITNAIRDVGAARGRRKEITSDILPEQMSPERPSSSPGFILALKWQDYALGLTDLECDEYARVRRREHCAQLFEEYDGQFSASFLANDGFLAIKYFESADRPTWPKFAKAHRLSKQGTLMLMHHLRLGLDAVPSDVP